MKRPFVSRRAFWLAAFFLALGFGALAQFGPPGGFGGRGRGGGRGGGGGGRFRGGGGGGQGYDVPPPRDIFPASSFTFCRIIFDRNPYGPGGNWGVDTPQADINLSIRLAQATTIRINHTPDGQVQRVEMRLTDPELYKYPIAFITEPGAMTLSAEEQEAMRSYMLRGGFLIIDDFHGDDEWANFEYEMHQVLPPADYPIVEIPIKHQIFNMVFPIGEVPQVPVIRGYSQWKATGDAVEYGHNYASGDTRPHCRGIFDKQGRLMCTINFNTDLGDSWQQEGTDPGYFLDFSARRGFPMGINMIAYAMTH